MKRSLHALAAAMGVEDCSMSTLDAAASVLSLVSPYSGAAWTTDLTNLRSCQHQTDSFKQSAGAALIVIFISVSAYWIGSLTLPRTPPQKAEDTAKYSFPKVVAFMESMPLFGVIITMTFLDLVCSVIEMLAMGWLMGNSMPPSIKRCAETFGLFITLWMVAEQHVSVFGQGTKTFFSHRSNTFGYLAVMIDLFFDLFAENMAGFAGLLLVVRLFKIYRVIDAVKEVDEHLKHLDSELKHAEHDLHAAESGHTWFQSLKSAGHGVHPAEQRAQGAFTSVTFAEQASSGVQGNKQQRSNKQPLGSDESNQRLCC